MTEIDHTLKMRIQFNDDETALLRRALNFWRTSDDLLEGGKDKLSPTRKKVHDDMTALQIKLERAEGDARRNKEREIAVHQSMQRVIQRTAGAEYPGTLVINREEDRQSSRPLFNKGSRRLPLAELRDYHLTDRTAGLKVGFIAVVEGENGLILKDRWSRKSCPRSVSYSEVREIEARRNTVPPTLDPEENETPMFEGKAS